MSGRQMTADRMSALIEVKDGLVVRSYDENGKAAWRMSDGSEANGRALGWLSRFGYIDVISMEGMESHPVVLSVSGEIFAGETVEELGERAREVVAG